MRIRKQQMVEADVTSFVDTGLSKKELFYRKTTLARVLKQVLSAVKLAEDAGNNTLAEQLREKAAYLKELLDTAEDVDYTPVVGSGPEVPGDHADDADDADTKDEAGMGDGPEKDDGKSTSKKEKKEEEGKDDGKELGLEDEDEDDDKELGLEDENEDDDKELDPDSGSGKIGKEPKKKPMSSKSKRPTAPPDPFERAKEILSSLKSNDAKAGAAAGLKDLAGKLGINLDESLCTSLQEAITKTVSQMSDDEFNDVLADAMALVDEIKPVSYSDDLDDRVARINKDLKSPTTRIEIEKEDAEHTKDERKAMQASEKDRARFSRYKALKTMDDFKSTLYRAMSDQVMQAEEEEDSWAALDRRHEDDPSIIVPGKILDDKFNSEIPTINVYFDQSGSWSDREIEVGMRAISTINEFHEREEIILNVFYMSAAGVFSTPEPARADGSAEGWYDALQHIKASGVKNVVVLSDEHLDYFEDCNRPTGDNGRTIVDGCVWWLWKNGSTSTKAPKELIGRSGDFHYNFNVRSS